MRRLQPYVLTGLIRQRSQADISIMTCDVLSFVWKEYDTNNILVADTFQRVFTKDELCDKIKEVKKSDKWLKKIKSDFLNKLPTEKEYYKEFDKILNASIN